MQAPILAARFAGPTFRLPLVDRTNLLIEPIGATQRVAHDGGKHEPVVAALSVSQGTPTPTTCDVLHFSGSVSSPRLDEAERRVSSTAVVLD